MMIETINIIKQGVIVKQFSCEHYSLNIMNSMVTIQDKESRKVTCVISPFAYDYVEVEQNESDA